MGGNRREQRDDQGKHTSSLPQIVFEAASCNEALSIPIPTCG